ncbi:M56 family metallopeptidase [Blastopirellula marina]|uniref:Peptidase M56 domain-containing protein n=1 Tax=Blastopirellula marina TaxID=124 RepID=A0A2S8GLN8_9BACT|nr:M56 family metallopeptidase [Blastopirellula marina]PQO45330.1 hypothetical protein C5Y93_15390 [Blastopirellula marina]
MSWLLSLPMFAMNLAIAATLCLAVPLFLTRCFTSLPKRYGLLLAGLIGSLAAPLAVALGAWLSLGMLPTIEVAQSEPEGTIPPRIAGDTSPVTTPISLPSQAEARPLENEPQMGIPRPALPMPANLPADLDEASKVSEASAAADVPGETTAAMPWLAVVGFSLVGGWLLGSLFVLLRHLRSWLLCRAFVRSCDEVEDSELRELVARQCERLGITTPVRLLESSSLPAPVVVGWLRPAMVLPEEIAFDLTASQLRRVVAHELSHIERRDHWTSGAQVAANILYWWNPLLHLVSRRMNALREMICDDIATSLDAADVSQAERTDYAASLVKLAERAIEHEAMAGSLGISLSSFTEMERRVRRILTERTGTVELKITRRFMAGLSTLGLMLAVGLAFAQVPGEEKEVAEKEEAAEAEVAHDTNEEKAEESARQMGQLVGKVVDGAGQPVIGADVKVLLPGIESVWRTTTDANGDFQLEVEVGKNFFHQIRACSADGKQMGFYHYPSDKVAQEEVRKITLEPVKSAVVHVQDQDGQAVAGAKVAVQLATGSEGPVFTDEKGEANVLIPESATILSVVAWKDDFGLDYVSYELPREQRGDLLAEKPEFPYEKGQTLTLAGATPLTVHVTETSGQPLENVLCSVWLLNKPDTEHLNLSLYTECFREPTDASGTVVFDWFPAWQTNPTVVWPYSTDFPMKRGEYDPAVQKGTLDIRMHRLVPLRGRVTFPDGKPAADIDVSANGVGYESDSFREETKTDKAGCYEFMAAPNQIYMLTVLGGEWVAPAQSGFAILPEEVVPEHDFVLRPATKLTGKLINEANGTPLANHGIYVRQSGIALSDMPEGSLPEADPKQTWIRPMTQVNGTTNEAGEFEFLLADGEYQLSSGGWGFKNLTIAGEKELHVDLKSDKTGRYERAVLVGNVVDDATGKPIANARVHGATRDFTTNSDWQANANEEGIFQVTQLGRAAYVMATNITPNNPNGILAGLAEVDTDESQVTVRLKKMGRVVGRLMSEDGTKPASGVRLDYGFRVYDVKKRFSSTRFGGTVMTDAEGRFALESLIPGIEYECKIANHPSGFLLNVAKPTVEPGQTLDLGDCKTPKPPKPYVPPTLEDQIQSAFDSDKTPLERLASGKKNIATVNQNMLIVFAEPLDPRVHELMKIRWKDMDFRKMSDDFRFLAVPTDAERIEAAQTLAKELELPALQEKGELLLVVIDHEGNLSAKITADQVCDGETLSKAKLLNELEQYQTMPLDARKLLDEALAQAKQEDKRVLVQETATWCGPCHRLSHLLLDHPQWQKDYVWVKMDHRWTGAQEIMNEMRGEANGGIPWFAILDAEGNTLATCNEPDQGRNIGYPSEDWGQKHFAEMLKSTRQRMTDQEIDDLVNAAK